MRTTNDQASPRSPEEPREPDPLSRLAQGSDPSWHVGARLRNYFITGLVVVGPVTITLYIGWWFINAVDAWVKPWLPRIYNPDTYLPVQIPGVGLIFAILGLMMIGALTANLLGRALVSSGELMLGRMPIVRNVYSVLKQVFESVVQSTDRGTRLQKVGLLEFPSKGIWSIVFVTADGTEEIKTKLSGLEDLITVFMPTGFLPPTGFVCFVPRSSVVLLNMSVEDAAKIVVSAGMATPDQQEKLKSLMEVAVNHAPPPAAPQMVKPAQAAHMTPAAPQIAPPPQAAAPTVAAPAAALNPPVRPAPAGPAEPAVGPKRPGAGSRAARRRGTVKT